MAAAAFGSFSPATRFSRYQQYQRRQRKLTCTAALAAPPTSTSGIYIQQAEGEHLETVARLRADAYYENQHSRFVESFKKQFVLQEVDSLQKRTKPTGANNMPQCECLVAQLPDNPDEVVGCIDIRLPFSQTGVRPAGVPDEDPQGAYILNVVVSEDVRGQGIGRALMQSAMSRAVYTWGAGALYTHVEADNEVAYGLYTRCGFEEHSSESKYSTAVSLGKLVLLKAPAAAAEPFQGLEQLP